MPAALSTMDCAETLQLCDNWRRREPENPQSAILAYKIGQRAFSENPSLHNLTWTADILQEYLRKEFFKGVQDLVSDPDLANNANAQKVKAFTDAYLESLKPAS